MNIDSFYKIATRYKVIFFDSYGVLKSYNGIIEGADNTLNMLKEEGIDFIVLTNDASKSPELLARNFKKIGLNHLSVDKIVSSGMLTRSYMKEKVPVGKIAYTGTKSSADYFREVGFEMIAIDKIEFEQDELDAIQALIFLDDEGFDWRVGLNNAVNLLRMRNIPVVVANTDNMYPIGDDSIAIATGGIAELVENVTGKKFLRFGKPDVQIFGYAFDHINETKTKYQRSEILMVGDTLTTDIIGANKFGIDTVLVLTGNTIPDQSEFLIKSSGIIPNYICNSIAID
jgi:HAD superfamily hydrolase (TIGR01450 family)